jgi:rfaE bifunctional protein kinase chain/domain
VIARNQHIVRIDRESREDLSPEIETKLINRFYELASRLDAVIYQDYNKGVVSERIIAETCDVAYNKGIISAVDPKFHNFFQYRKVTIFKPNIKETEAALVTKIRTEEDIIKCGKRIFEQIQPQHLLITRGSKGMTLFMDKDNYAHLPTRALKVHDVSGAGDTVIATLVAFLTAGADLKEAATIANFAAGAVCEEVGVAPIQGEKLKTILLEHFT